ncbi:MAG: patatin-like phospholipase family protein [Terriglobales bacterium]
MKAIGHWTVGVVCALVVGCAALPRGDPPPLEDASAIPPGFSPGIRWFGETRQDFEARAPQLLEKARAAAGGGPVNVLALSGGGAGGAFGAGALVGWTRLGTRPRFQIVTGISTGALIAPLAFLGSDWDPQLALVFSRHGTPPMQRLHEHVLRLLFGVSVARGQPLAALVDRYVTPQMVQALARASAKGGLLIVATMDLDAGQTVFWDLGRIAEQGGPPALQLIRRVLIASASVPGVFPPVMINVEQANRMFEEMHVDDAAAEPLFFIPDLAAILPGSLSPLAGGRLYLIVNGPLRMPAGKTPLRSIAILRRTIGATLQSGTKSAVEIAYTFAHEHQMRIAMTEIPNAYPYDGPLDFNAKKMRALFGYGERCAFAGQLWSDPLEVLNRAASTVSPVRHPAELAQQGPIACPAAAAGYVAN